MRPQTKNEKVLLWILVAIAFLFGNYFGYTWLVKKQKAVDLSIASMKADQAEANLALTQVDLWTQRKGWIKEHQPEMADEGSAKADVLEQVLKGARDNKLEILDQSLNDVNRTPAGARVNVSVKVKGSTENLVKWLSALENPTQFYAVSLFSLKADQDQKSMVCTLQMSRYFRGGNK